MPIGGQLVAFYMDTVGGFVFVRDDETEPTQELAVFQFSWNRHSLLAVRALPGLGHVLRGGLGTDPTVPLRRCSAIVS